MIVPTSPDLLATLHKNFGFDSFRPGQEEAIRRVLAGQHTLLVMPTGAGKSLAYQLPALLLPGLTLVISPLIALMKDQVDALLDAEVPATFINSSLPLGEQNRRLRAMREGHLKLIYVAPERLRSNQFIRALANVPVSLLAVDEAHCVSQWGHDFRPDYLQIRPAWEGLGCPPLLATTATATPQVQTDILKLLGASQARPIVTGFNRPNLTFEVRYAATEDAKLRVLRQLILKLSLDPSPSATQSQEGVTRGSAIIYVGTRRAAEEVAAFVRDVLGLRAEAYHAGLEGDLRHHVQNAFMSDDLPIVVATNAFGMGVDKPDIRAVMHYHMPATIEAYYQEGGRAGRDGLPALCALLFSPDDRGLQEWFIDSDTPTLDDLRTVHRLVGRVAQDGEALVGRDELADAAGFHPTKVRITLSELEQAGALLHLGDQVGYARWRVLSPAEGALEARARSIAARAEHRHQLLDRIVAYAESEACRRRYLLDYFGDNTSLVGRQTPVKCCDNCHAGVAATDLPPAKSAEDWIPLIVLETVRTLPRPVGRVRLAHILRGSEAKDLLRMGYQRHRFYGKLAHLRQEHITSVIDMLVENRYLALTGDDRRPVAKLTSKGLTALKTRVAIPFANRLPAPPDPAVEGWKRRGARSVTVAETLALHQQGLSPSQIAEARGRSVSTIYGHLAGVIAEAKIELESVVAPDVIARVRAVVQEIGPEPLSPIKQRLPETISYGEIQCVIAGLASGDRPGRSRPETGGEEPDVSHTSPERPEITHSPPVDEALFETLRRWRTALAREQKVAPYVIFRDRALRAIAANRPTDPDALLAIPGVGRAKMERYGHAVLAIVQAHLADTSQASSVPAPAPVPEAAASPIPQAMEEVVLKAVADLEGLLTRSGLARLLTGSGSERVAPYRDHALYGALCADRERHFLTRQALTRQEVTAEIDRLIAEGYLIERQGRLRLAPTGQARLQGTTPTAPGQPPR